MKKLITTLLFFSVFSASAEIAVIVNVANSNALTQKEISRIFLGKLNSYPDDSEAVPIVQDETSAAAGEFNEKVNNKSVQQVKGIWSRLIFSGKAEAPATFNSDADVIKAVAANPKAISYVNSSAVTPDVKVIGKF